MFGRKKTTQSTVGPGTKTKVKIISLQETAQHTFSIIEETFEQEKGFVTMLFCDFSWVLDSLSGPNNTSQKKSGFALILGSEDIVKARRHIVTAMGGAAAILTEYGFLGEPTTVRMASEAWMSVINTPKNLKDDKLVMPSQDPNKVEVLLVMAANNKNLVTQIREIVRDKKTDSVKLVTNERITKANGEVKLENSLLENYWQAYYKGKKMLENKKMYKVFERIVKRDSPQETFSYIIKTALDTAEKYNIQT